MENRNNKIDLFLINKDYLNFMRKMGIKGIDGFEYGISTYLDDRMYFVPLDLKKEINVKNSFDNLLLESILPIEDSEHFVIKQEIKINLESIEINSNEFNDLTKLEKLLVLINKNQKMINSFIKEIFKK